MVHTVLYLCTVPVTTTSCSFLVEETSSLELKHNLRREIPLYSWLRGKSGQNNHEWNGFTVIRAKKLVACLVNAIRRESLKLG